MVGINPFEPMYASHPHVVPKNRTCQLQTKDIGRERAKKSRRGQGKNVKIKAKVKAWL